MPELENGPSRESEKARTPRRIRRILQETPVNEPMPEWENGPGKREDANSKPNPARDTRQRTDARVGKRPWKARRRELQDEFAESC